MRPGNDVALTILELRLRLFHGELLVSTRLLKHLPARGDATKAAPWRHNFHIGIEQLFGRVQVTRDDSLDELSCSGELHRRNLVSANAIFKLASIANEEVLVTRAGSNPSEGARGSTLARLPDRKSTRLGGV
jgi:hypothetical protein